jgi:hypothetical protein
MNCDYDTGSMFGCYPACQAPAEFIVCYRSMVDSRFGPRIETAVCAQHVRAMENRVHPNHTGTYLFPAGK